MVKETGDVAFRKRETNVRKKIILTLLVVAIIYGPNHGKFIIYEILKQLLCKIKIEIRKILFFTSTQAIQIMSSLLKLGSSGVIITQVTMRLSRSAFSVAKPLDLDTT